MHAVVDDVTGDEQTHVGMCSIVVDLLLFGHCINHEAAG